jgi:hypothetical protein
LDHVIVLSEGNLKGLLKEFIDEYYPIARSYQGLSGVSPVLAAKSLRSTAVGRLVSIPLVGGRHHRYLRLRLDSLAAAQFREDKAKHCT